MKKFITYFDFLGFKNFILNNNSDYIRRRIGHILRDIELAIGQGNTTRTNYGVVANISNSKINCLNISDTVIFWTKDASYESFNELLKISFDFNWSVTCYHFPVRGAIVFDEIEIISGYQETENGGTYNVNSVFGKGLVKAHLKADNLNIASCVIDYSVIEKIQEFGDLKEIIGDYGVEYNVPYKNGEIMNPEFVLKFFINRSINEEAFLNRSKGIADAFKGDKKGMNKRAEEMLDNTIEFLGLLKE